MTQIKFSYLQKICLSNIKHNYSFLLNILYSWAKINIKGLDFLIETYLDKSIEENTKDWEFIKAQNHACPRVMSIVPRILAMRT